MSIERLRRFITREAIFLTLAPAVALTAGYFFELGYAHHFGYPQELIKVDFQTTIIAFATCASLLGAWYFYFELAFSKSGKKRSTRWIFIRAFLIAAAIWLPFFLAMDFKGIRLIYVLGTLLQGALLTRYKMRMQRSGGEEGESDQPLEGSTLIFACIWAGVLIYGIGKYSASMKKFWLQTFEMDSKTYALVAAYDDMGIGVLVEDGRLMRYQTITFNLTSSGNIRFAEPEKFLK